MSSVYRQRRVLSTSSAVFIVIVALLLSLWAATSVIKSLMEGFHAAYRIPRSRSFLRETGVGILLVFLSVVPLIGASALIRISSGRGSQLRANPIPWLAFCRPIS